MLKRIAFAALTLASTAAFAQQHAPEKTVEYRHTTVINGFEDEEVDGNFDHPGETIIEIKRPLRHVSMIPSRSNFIPEMCKSAENL